MRVKNNTKFFLINFLNKRNEKISSSKIGLFLASKK